MKISCGHGGENRLKFAAALIQAPFPASFNRLQPDPCNDPPVLIFIQNNLVWRKMKWHEQITTIQGRGTGLEERRSIYRTQHDWPMAPPHSPIIGDPPYPGRIPQLDYSSNQERRPKYRKGWQTEIEEMEMIYEDLTRLPTEPRPARLTESCIFFTQVVI